MLHFGITGKNGCFPEKSQTFWKSKYEFGNVLPVSKNGGKGVVYHDLRAPGVPLREVYFHGMKTSTCLTSDDQIMDGCVTLDGSMLMTISNDLSVGFMGL